MMKFALFCMRFGRSAMNDIRTRAKNILKKMQLCKKDKVYDIVSSHITVQLSLYNMITKLFRSTEINQIRFQTVI